MPRQVEKSFFTRDNRAYRPLKRHESKGKIVDEGLTLVKECYRTVKENHIQQEQNKRIGAVLSVSGQRLK